jgi:hypothetical protein
MRSFAMRNLITRSAGVALVIMLAASPSYAEDCNAAGTVGSGGSAAAGGTSASTLGTAGTCVTDDGTTSSIGSAGSAASADGKAKTRTKVMDNDQQLNAQSKAQAMDQGTFSKSQTKTRVNGDELDSDTRTMSHVPGQKPIKSTTKNSVIVLVVFVYGGNKRSARHPDRSAELIAWLRVGTRIVLVSAHAL